MGVLTESERLQKLIEIEQMTARQFSEEIGIQPGTISNIIKGRNKPSLEVMQKVLARFRLVSPEWLILGVGTMYRQKNDSQPTLFDIKPTEDSSVLSARQVSEESELPVSETVIRSRKQPAAIVQEKAPKRIRKVVVFFDDGTYDEVLR